jgi:hypothetical protein
MLFLAIFRNTIHALLTEVNYQIHGERLVSALSCAHPYSRRFPVPLKRGTARFFNDLDRLIAKNEREKPGFAAAVKKRKGELLIAARLRETRENLKLTQREVVEKWSLSQ